MDWFLYDIGLRHERVKLLSSVTMKNVRTSAPQYIFHPFVVIWQTRLKGKINKKILVGKQVSYERLQ